MRWAPGLLATVALLVGCEREPVRTVVHGPAPAPVAAAPASVAQAPPAQPPMPVATPESPVADAHLAQAPPTPMGDAASPGDREGAALLALRELQLPVAGIQPDQLSNTYDQVRGARRHEAIDIMAPRGTPVHAVDDGTLVKLFNSKPGGLTAYQFDREGRLSYYYAHLDRYAEGLREGMQLRRGDVIGYVGVTGNAAPDSPHLHFAVFRLGPEKQWWKGEPVNPYPALRQARPSP